MGKGPRRPRRAAVEPEDQAEGNSTDSREQHGVRWESRGTVIVYHLHRSLSPPGFSFVPGNMGMARYLHEGCCEA